ncbi:MAG: isochorismatase family protein [Candidatus Eisenbacteria bacterium]|nr:isochorismatase family protein [Candidatus Eisenbacteria bacterium]
MVYRKRPDRDWRRPRDRRRPMLDSSRSVLVVIDVQEKLLPHIHRREDVVRSIVRLIEGCRILDVPVLATEQYTRGLGPTDPAVRDALREAPLLEKMSFACQDHEPFAAALRETGRRQVLLCGIEAHVCVYQTALGLKEDGFGVHVAGDAVSSRFPRNIELALMRFQQEGIRITSVESAVFEMLKLCGTDPFKAWLKVLKEA